jgi:phosphatidylserine decarboxylase
LQGQRNPFVAREGIIPLLLALLAIGVTWHYLGFLIALGPAVIFTWLFLIFRDPQRSVEAAPLGIVSPVDGTVVDVELTDHGLLGGEAHRVTIKVDSLGTYTARCPVEGKIMDFRGEGKNETVRRFSGGLWVQTDEGEDVVLQFKGHRFGLAPIAFMRFGERVGQGQRCAYLRLTRCAEIQFPINGRVLVEPGQRITAGTDLLGKLPPH